MSRRSFAQLGQGLCLGLALAVIAASPAWSQTSTGSIRGYVRDASSAPVAGARVIAVNGATSAQREVTTQSNGFYTIVGLVPGEYDVTARQIGMASQKAHVRVLIAEVVPLDFKLGPSAVQLEAVTVAAAAGVETQTSEVATSVTPQQMRALPSASHNFLDLAALAPGVSVAPDFANLGSSNAGVTDKAFSYGGQGPGQVNVFIDGASLKNDLTGGESGIHGGTFGQDASRGNPFPRAAIQEYRVITQNFKAEYQQSSGAIIVATTRAGGNVWSGDVSFGYQNKNLVARDSISKAQTFGKPDYTRYLADLSIGGPLVKDRLFFFGSYEGNYQNRDALVRVDTGNALAPPGTFPALDTVRFGNYNGNFTSPFRETLLFGKLNYNVNSHSSAELSFNDRHETDVRDFGGFSAFQNATNHAEDATTTIFKYNYFAGPWLNETNITYEHFNQNPTPDTPNLPQRWYALPKGCCITLGSNLSIQNLTQERVALRDDITYSGFHSGGDHVLKAGVSAAFLTYDIHKANREIPQFFFGQNVSPSDAGCAAPSVPVCTGNEAYNYRVPFQMVWQHGNSAINTNNNQIGAYLQDDWSPTPRLTINLGIRWDFETHMYNYDYVTPTDVRDSIRRYDASPVTPAESLVAKFDTTAYFTNGTQRHKFYGAFQPRVGFSYALDRDSKTTIFGGWGLYYDRTYFDISIDETLKLIRPEYTVHFADPDSTPTSTQLAWQNSYMTADTTVLKSLLNRPAREVWLIANTVKVPKSGQFNLGIRRLFGDVAVSATYVGVRSWDGLVFNWGNFALKADGTCCQGGGYGHGFSNIIFSTNSAKTWYDALQVEVTRPYKRTGSWGWGGGLSYTSGSRSLEGSNVVGDVFSTFPRSTAYPKHPASDEKSRLVANWTMDVPYAAGVQFGGLITLGTGPRYNVGGIFPLTSYTPGGFTPPQHAFIFPGGWAYRDVDFRLRKDFPNISGTTLSVTVDMFNVFNFNNFSYPDNSGGNPQPNGLLSDPRKTQIGIEYHF